MITLEDLPRQDGIASGAYHLVHKHDSFCAEGYGFRFEAGRTVEPITGRPMMRLLMSMGVDLTIEPADMDTARAIWEHIHDRCYPESRIAEIGRYFSSLFTTENEKAEAERAAVAAAEQKARDEEAAALAEQERIEAEAQAKALEAAERERIAAEEKAEAERAAHSKSKDKEKEKKSK